MVQKPDVFYGCYYSNLFFSKIFISDFTFFTLLILSFFKFFQLKRRVNGKADNVMYLVFMFLFLLYVSYILYYYYHVVLSNFLLTKTLAHAVRNQ